MAVYEKAIDMYRQQHVRWNHWAVFYFGLIATVFLVHHQCPQFVPLSVAALAAALLSCVWVCVALSIRATSEGWRLVVQKLESLSQEQRESFPLFQEFDKQLEGYCRCQDLQRTLKVWTAEPYLRVTRLLTLVGVILAGAFFVLFVACLIGTPDATQELAGGSGATMIQSIPWIVSTIIAACAAFAAFLAWLTARRQAQDALWAVRFEAYKHAELEANTDAFLKVHNITEADLVAHGLTKDTFRAYLLWTNVLWTSVRTKKGQKKILKTNGYQNKVEVAREFTWGEDTHSGRILRSREFEHAWPLIRRFWATGDDSSTAPLIEAAVQIGREQRRDSNTASQDQGEEASEYTPNSEELTN